MRSFDHVVTSQMKKVITAYPACQVTWSFDHIVTWKIKKFMSVLQQQLWQPNLAEQWVKGGGHHPLSPINVWSSVHGVFICFSNICCYSIDNIKFFQCIVTLSRWWNNFDTILINFSELLALET